MDLPLRSLFKIKESTLLLKSTSKILLLAVSSNLRSVYASFLTQESLPLPSPPPPPLLNYWRYFSVLALIVLRNWLKKMWFFSCRWISSYSCYWIETRILKGGSGVDIRFLCLVKVVLELAAESTVVGLIFSMNPLSFLWELE